MALLPCFLSLWEILTLRPQGGCSSSGVGSLALSESVLEASVARSWTCWLGFGVLGADSFSSDASGLGLLSTGSLEMDETLRPLAEGNVFGTSGGLNTLHTVLAMLGTKRGSEKTTGT